MRISLPAPGGIVIGCVCVCLLIRSLVRCDFWKSEGPISMKFSTDVNNPRYVSLFTFQRSRSKFKVTTASLKISHLQ